MNAQKRKWEHIKSEWRQEKMKLMNALVGPSQNWIDIQKLPEQTVINETFGTRSCLNRIVSFLFIINMKFENFFLLSI